jgi:hypothetical protein
MSAPAILFSSNLKPADFIEPMLNSREGRVSVELNYPHIIGISGYQRHHVVATWSGEIRPNSFKNAHRDDLFACTNRAKPSIRSSVSVQALKLTANHGEAGAGTGSKS